MSLLTPTNNDYLEILTKRAQALKLIREFFWLKGFTEYDTPLLSFSLIPESIIQPVSCQLHYQNGKTKQAFLIPSPELWLKRLLALGSGDLFQLTKAFRDYEPPSPFHSIEFTILEWYKTQADYLYNLTLQEELISFLCSELNLPSKLKLFGSELNLSPPYLRLTMQQAFLELAGIKLPQRIDLKGLKEIAQKFKIESYPDDTEETLFHKIFLQEVEPLLPKDKPVFLLDYPNFIPTLARQKDKEEGFIERWELYIAGIEIANCYTEENNIVKIKRFFKNEENKIRKNKNTRQIDWDLIKYLPQMPLCSGNALGVDRLLLVLFGKEKLSEVIPFFPTK